jgi:hypothetical protein
LRIHEEIKRSPDDYRGGITVVRDYVRKVRQRPIHRFAQESAPLRPLPPYEFDMDEVDSAVVNSHAMIQFDGNRYSVPPQLQGTTVMIRASATYVRAFADGSQ